MGPHFHIRRSKTSKKTILKIGTRVITNNLHLIPDSYTGIVHYPLDANLEIYFRGGEALSYRFIRSTNEVEMSLSEFNIVRRR